MHLNETFLTIMHLNKRFVETINLNEKFVVIITFCGGVLGYFFGGLDILLNAFMITLAIDTLAGMIKSYLNGSYSSKLFRAGLLKKCGYMLAVILAVQLDKLTGNTGALRGAMLLFSVANEGTSIIENLGEIGIPFPEPIVNAIAVLRKKAENAEESEKKDQK